MKNTKTKKRFVYEGLGFPVVLLNVPMVKARGEWTPRIDYNKLARSVLLSLVRSPMRLTGNEIRFIRLHFEMTLELFGERFDVSHPAVLKWEATGDGLPALKWPIEKDIRLFVLDRLGVRPTVFKNAYVSLEDAAAATRKPLEMNAARAA